MGVGWQWGEEGSRRLAVYTLSLRRASALFWSMRVRCWEVSLGAGSGPGGVRVVVGTGGVVYAGGVEGGWGGFGVRGNGEESELVLV